ncbi:hypothetical protein ASPZODRAFT_1683575 [Penicilliopsis zonata CBS 506.65]|uniref:methionyl-tRNA formyltransferase n=1 Tax=Penicilliopsis zonata CBS 506.65 TaxID=1073090 RepID=A0A1L9SJY2_9EURO|nr:hypothetical protein ASPZODRAFT_1683575 [Penicilliopsis zonata CBS 506.65]OJJ47477.1 hypothetical protein ASPZODRAFT_1683575 [Penicilliopsis zonata CBS 506.65]
MRISGNFGVLRLLRRVEVPRSCLYSSSSTQAYDPLRILFCGSDDFSIASLKALHDEHVKRPDRIASIDVVCRPGKRVGRGWKNIREVPIKAAAADLKLPVHEVDTFRGWTPPELPAGPVNLIVAVSFGLFVPSRLLNASKYGGLNLHPSLLPDFRGPAPLHYTLMAGRTRTGITLQTLHLKHFDHGVILAQTPAPGLEIPNPKTCTVTELSRFLAPKAAQMLVDGIRDGLFVPPLREAGWLASEKGNGLVHAAKITPDDRHVDWVNWTSLDISRRNRTIGPLWNNAVVAKPSADGVPLFQHRRVILTEVEEVDPPRGCDVLSLVPGLPFVDGSPPFESNQQKNVYIFTRDGKLLCIRKMKVEGETSVDAFRAALKAKMTSSQPFNLDSGSFTPFYNPLS